MEIVNIEGFLVNPKQIVYVDYGMKQGLAEIRLKAFFHLANGKYIEKNFKDEKEMLVFLKSIGCTKKTKILELVYNCFKELIDKAKRS